MNFNIFEQSLTISEKMRYFDKDISVDYSALNNWRDCRTLLNDRYFNEMLQNSGYTREQFAFSLQPLSKSNKNIQISWLNDYKNIISNFKNENIDYSLGVSIVAIPFVKFMNDKILAELENLTKIDINPSIINKFSSLLINEIFDIFGKILALKLAEYKNKFKENSENKTHRFELFIKETFTTKESFETFFKEYPVATRLATTRTTNLTNNYLELLSRLNNDIDDIKKVFNINSESLTDISISEGDSHEQGKSVMVLIFNNQKVVYKPKNLEVSIPFQKFIEWYSKCSDLLELKIPRGIFKNDYTYNEFIDFVACETENDVEDFYIRYGQLVAISYLLNMNDLHMENIIAHGSQPVIVDLETLFQVSPSLENESVSADILKRLEIDSVRNSCLLPSNLNVGINAKVELSAFKGGGGEVQNQFVTPVNINTDDFHFEKGNGYFKGGNNIPQKLTSDGIMNVDYDRYRIKILEGFNSFMKFILNNKKEFIQFISLNFKGYQLRVLLKGTERYASLLRYSNHPSYNKEMKYRERLFMNSWAYPYKDKRVVLSEVEDLLFNDIPIFYTKTNSRDIFDSRKRVYKEYFSNSGLDTVIKKIKNLNETEIDFQRQILLSSLGVSDIYLNKNQSNKLYIDTGQVFDSTRAAIEIADFLMSEVIEKNDEASFVNLNCDEELHWRFVPCDESLYSGVAGIALFFLEIYKKTKLDKYFEMYKKLITTAVNQAKFQPFSSAYQGRLSPIYPLLMELKYFGTISNKDFLDKTLDELNEMETEKYKEIFKQSEYINGLSSVLSLLQLVNKIYKPYQKTVAELKSLLSNYLNGNDESLTVTGVAHGISGILLGSLSSGILEKSVIDSLLIKEKEETSMPSEDLLKWCKGLPGLIYTRIKILEVYKSSIAETQLKELLSEFKKELFKIGFKDDSICHGLSGSLIVLSKISQYTQLPEWRALLNTCATNLYINSQFNHYSISHLNNIFSKGLFDGISGVGLTYLYLSNSCDGVLFLGE